MLMNTWLDLNATFGAIGNTRPVNGHAIVCYCVILHVGCGNGKQVECCAICTGEYVKSKVNRDKKHKGWCKYFQERVWC